MYRAENGTTMRNEYATMAGFLCLPQDAIERNTVVDIDAMDNSMLEEGIRQGDRLRVQLTRQVRDGDIVWACVSDKSAIRVYFTDEQGKTWLLPRNDDYDAFRITHETDVRIIGRVVEHVKGTMRASYADCERSVKRLRIRQSGKEGISAETAKEVIQEVAPYVKNTRQWYAVFRPLVDKGALPSYGFDTFVEWVLDTCEHHPCPPSATELRRMMTDSFSKPVSHWTIDRAPVSGKRFKDYLSLAEKVLARLTE